MKLPDEGDLHQRRPGDSSRDSPRPGLDSGYLVLYEQIIGPLLWGPCRKRRHRNTVQSHDKCPKK